MSDLRYRMTRMKMYGRLCPADMSPAQRQELLDRLDRQDEDGIEILLGEVALDGDRKRALALLAEARSLGDRLNVMDRTLPSLPHVEITAVYNRLRALGDELADMEARGALQ